MTDNEIIKALEDEIERANYIESYYIDCVDIGVFQNVLDLINRQKAEIERLHIDLISIRSAANSYKKHYETVKSEAIKEFAERLKESLDGKTDPIDDYDIDDLVKEMTEVQE